MHFRWHRVKVPTMDGHFYHFRYTWLRKRFMKVIQKLANPYKGYCNWLHRILTLCDLHMMNESQDSFATHSDYIGPPQSGQSRLLTFCVIWTQIITQVHKNSLSSRWYPSTKNTWPVLQLDTSWVLGSLTPFLVLCILPCIHQYTGLTLDHPNQCRTGITLS